MVTVVISNQLVETLVLRFRFEVVLIAVLKPCCVFH